MSFKKFTGDWTILRQRKLIVEIDFHHEEQREIPYHEAMEEVQAKALDAIIRAYGLGLHYVLLTHGQSTSRPGKTTSRSKIRQLIKNKEVTPYVIRSKCLQHESAFLVALKKRQGTAEPVATCPTCEDSNNVAEQRVAGTFKCGSCKTKFDWFESFCAEQLVNLEKSNEAIGGVRFHL